MGLHALAGESYGGVYVPKLSKEILDNAKGLINFKGVSVGDPCTDNLCAANQCVFPKQATEACSCMSPLLCDDLNPCTVDTCASGACAYAPVDAEGCCVDDSQCDDGDAQTFDACQQGLCSAAASRRRWTCCSRPLSSGATRRSTA